MHELAVCNALMEQVRATARQHGAGRVGRITVRIGPLSGVEPDLLQHAFSIARAGKYTGSSELIVETTSIRIRCRVCGNENEAAANRLLCDVCGAYNVEVCSGEEMLLASIELQEVPESRPERESSNAKGEASHV